MSTIFNQLEKYYYFSTTTEITLEINPEDINKEKINIWRQVGINRLSIGVQSFFDHHLSALDREHTAEKSFSSLQLALEEGFQNISIDLIYGVPGLSLVEWRKNLEMFLSLSLPHLSCYLLTVEDKTKLQKQIQKKQMILDKDSNIVKQYHTLLEMTEKYNYIHYEISNFALNNHFSKHNSNYWGGTAYLGLGPSAHSFDGKKTRYYNIANNHLYIQNLKDNKKIREEEKLTAQQRYNEYLMTSLRTMWGCSIDIIDKHFSQKENFLLIANKYLDDGYLLQRGDIIMLSNKGKLFSNQIFLDFFLV